MLKIGMPVRSDDGTVGTIEKTSIRTGVKLYRVCDRWFERGAIEAV